MALVGLAAATCLANGAQLNAKTLKNQVGLTQMKMKNADIVEAGAPTDPQM